MKKNIKLPIGSFTGEEVMAMLAYYGLEDRFDTVREWYDGYRFSSTEVYCPWDVISYTGLLRSEPDAPPRAFRANTSGNDIIRRFIGMAPPRTRREIECLVDGGAVSRKVNQELFCSYLARTISIRDTGDRRGRKEHFYHGIPLGLLGHRDDWIVSSNAESGDGYSDILVEDEEKAVGIVIEVKYAEDGDMEAGCEKALAQIGRMGYEAALRQNGAETVIRYGVACYKKKCRIRLGGSPAGA